MSELKTEKSTPDRADNKFVTAPDTAVFWSGRTGTMGGQHRAAEIAQVVGGTTLEMLVKDRGHSLPKYDSTDQTTIDAWEKASARFAMVPQSVVYEEFAGTGV